jgi:RNA polymerase sigma-70 factor, ECF subfamily
MPSETVNQMEAFGIEALSDEEIVERVRLGESALFEILMRRYNQRLYRVTRGILRNDGEAEDVIQQAYVQAYLHLAQFSGKGRFSSWLTKIAVHEAFARLRAQRRFVEPSALDGTEVGMDRFESADENAENQLLRQRIGEIMETAIDSLPEKYRIVFMLREVEGMSTEETSGCLDIGLEAVKSRLFRAKGILRKEISARTAGVTPSLFQFGAERCDRIVAIVLKQLREIERERQNAKQTPIS